MTSKPRKCPECGSSEMLIVMRAGVLHWLRCAACDWDEKHQLETKIREELANGDGLDDEGDGIGDDARESA